MSTIVFSSSKGGAGKTTAAIVLACEFARQGKAKGLRVAIIDADPNQHCTAWAAKDGKPQNIDVVPNATGETILDTIGQAQDTADFVIVDLEGVASQTVVGALSLADLVIVPCQPSQNDAKEAVKTIKTIQYAARVARRQIPFAVLFSRMSAAIITKTARELSDEFKSGDVDLFDCYLIDREAFKNIFAFGGDVNSLEATNQREAGSITKAAENARQFAEEVKNRLMKSQKENRSVIHEKA